MQAQRGWVSRPKGAGICRLRAAKPHPPFSFPRKKTGGVTVQKKGVSHCKRAARRAAMLADCTALCAALPRLALLYDLTCSYYPLLRSRWRLCRLTDAVHPLRVPLCPSCRSTAQFPSTASLHNAASAAMPLFRTQSAAEKTSHAPHDSKARLRPVTTRRDSWRSHVHRTYTAQRVQLFKPKTGNGNLSLGGFKGGYSLSRKRVSPFCPFPTPGGGNERGSPLLL